MVVVETGVCECVNGQTGAIIFLGELFIGVSSVLVCSAVATDLHVLFVFFIGVGIGIGIDYPSSFHAIALSVCLCVCVCVSGLSLHLCSEPTQDSKCQTMGCSLSVCLCLSLLNFYHARSQQPSFRSFCVLTLFAFEPVAFSA